MRAPRGAYKQVMSASAAELIKSYMATCVKSGTGANAAVKGQKICGKTGTAEVSSDRNAKTNAWFVGFVDDPNHPYAVAVVVESGGAGSDRAAKLAAKVFKKAIDLGV